MAGLELEPESETELKLWTKVELESEPKINNFGSATLLPSTIFYFIQQLYKGKEKYRIRNRIWFRIQILSGIRIQITRIQLHNTNFCPPSVLSAQHSGRSRRCWRCRLTPLPGASATWCTGSDGPPTPSPALPSTSRQCFASGFRGSSGSGSRGLNKRFKMWIHHKNSFTS